MTTKILHEATMRGRKGREKSHLMKMIVATLNGMVLSLPINIETNTVMETHKVTKF